MSKDETELLRVLLSGMPEQDAQEAIRAIKEAPPEKPAGRRRRRAGAVGAGRARPRTRGVG